MTQPLNPRISSLFELQYPQSVAFYDSYAQAQAAVDFLADSKFAVQNLAIVGTDLKSFERVTGRRNWRTVLVKGLQNGVSTGLMVTFILWFLQPTANPLVLLPGALGIGILIGVAFAAIAYAAARGKRDFNSISQTIAARYEVLCEHKVAAQARELLATMPGARAAAFDPRQAQQWQPPVQQPPYPAQPQPGQYPYPAQAYPGQPHQPAPQQPYSQQASPQPEASPPPSAESPHSPRRLAPGGDQAPGPRPYGSYGADEGIGSPPETTGGDGRPPRGDG